MKISKASLPLLLGGFVLTMGLTACGPTGSSTSVNTGPHTQDEVDAYMENLAKTSEEGHFYYHYLRFDASAESYNDWDVWCWPYRPNEGQGVKFDWKGRSQGTDDLKTASGNPVIDEFGYVYVDIDLTKSNYDGGWSEADKKIGGDRIDFAANHELGSKEEKIGLQIVKSATRTGSGFWTNDGSNLYVTVDDFALVDEERGVTSYHAFVTQDLVQSVTKTPVAEPEDPFEGDDGKNETYNNAKYNDVDFSTTAPIKETSPEFLKGDQLFENGAGTGYQIMVSSFADSDADGFGDIYGIVQHLDYIKNLGVDVIWLTPVQLSDSYHGYDITDYLTVDPKFGSKVSPAGTENGGKVSEKTAMADYKLLLDEAHSRGMAVIMDLVINHTSTGNKWFVDSAQLDETMRGYYRWANHETGEDITIENCWYPYGDRVYSYYAKFGSSMPELNFSYTGTRAAVEAIALNWCEIGVDGFRMDAVKHIYMEDEVAYDENDTYVIDTPATGENYSSDLTKNLHFWRELNAAIKDKYPNAFVVGENFDGHAYHVAPYYEGFDSLFDFYSYFNLTSLAAKAYRNGVSGPYQGSAATYLGSTVSGTPYSASSDAALGGNKTHSVPYGGHWNLREAMSAYNRYRGGEAMPKTGSAEYSAIVGSFTSNHDIARSINRVAANAFNGDGIAAQGTVTTSNYESLDELATCVQISQLMLPGLTWIYYGDELGMSGNFPEGKNEDSDYADLYYRQPMKWDEEATRPHYGINGAEVGVELDEINASDLVTPAYAQMEDPNSHYNALAAFAKAKGSEPALIRGNFVPFGWDGNPYILNFQRILGDDVFHVLVNFSNQDAKYGEGIGTEILASYNGAGVKRSDGLYDLPSHSALLVRD